MTNSDILKNEKAISYIVSKLGDNEEGMSSHWQNFLKDFNYENGQFSSTGLPEGEGGRLTLLGQLAHYVLQYPYRKQGRAFSSFSRILELVKRIHKSRANQLPLASLRQAIAISQVADNYDVSALKSNVAVIGDGYGVMSSIISEGFEFCGKVVLVNLTQNLLIDAIYLKRFMPHKNIAVAIDSSSYLAALNDESVSFVLVRADDYRLLALENIGLAINICSMQEMDINIVRAYIQTLRDCPGDTSFYCANRESKELPGGEITKFADYGWSDGDSFVFDEQPDWQQKYYTWRPPFYLSYDGPIRHALIDLAK